MGGGGNPISSKKFIYERFKERNMHEEEKVRELASTLRRQGLAVSNFEAMEKARAILGVRIEKKDFEKAVPRETEPKIPEEPLKKEGFIGRVKEKLHLEKHASEKTSEPCFNLDREDLTVNDLMREVGIKDEDIPKEKDEEKEEIIEQAEKLKEEIREAEASNDESKAADIREKIEELKEEVQDIEQESLPEDSQEEQDVQPIQPDASQDIGMGIEEDAGSEAMPAQEDASDENIQKELDEMLKEEESQPAVNEEPQETSEQTQEEESQFTEPEYSSSESAGELQEQASDDAGQRYEEQESRQQEAEEETEDEHEEESHADKHSNEAKEDEEPYDDDSEPVFYR